jgi:nitrate/nitrite transporter NarK
MITAVIGGYISDRMGKRKVFVVVATFVIAVAALVLAFTPADLSGFTITMIAAAILLILCLNNSHNCHCRQHALSSH